MGWVNDDVRCSKITFYPISLSSIFLNLSFRLFQMDWDESGYMPSETVTKGNPFCWDTFFCSERKLALCSSHHGAVMWRTDLEENNAGLITHITAIYNHKQTCSIQLALSFSCWKIQFKMLAGFWNMDQLKPVPNLDFPTEFLVTLYNKHLLKCPIMLF